MSATAPSSGAPVPRVARRRALTWSLLLVVALVPVSSILLARQRGELSVQTGLNLRFVERPSLEAALTKYPKVRPPLYPLILRLADGAGLHPRAVQLVLLIASLALLAVALHRWAPEVAPFPLLGLHGVAHFNHANLYQFTAEPLFAALALAALLALDAWLARPRAAFLAAGAVAVSALCFTRHFALFWILPVAAMLVALAPAAPSRRAVRLAVFAAVALTPSAAWMAVTRAQTGSLLGADRLASRTLPGRARHWGQLQGPLATALLTARTLEIDAFAPDAYASLPVVTRPRARSGLEWALLGMALAATITAVVAGVRRARRSLPPLRALLPALLAATYVGAVLVLWSFGNNDPVHSRFLYPAYGLLTVVAAQAYQVVKQELSSAARIPWVVTCAAVFALQLFRSWVGLDIPVR